MTDNPEDIRTIAERLCKWLDAMPSEGNIHAIESAILAERERCAQIADERIQFCIDQIDLILVGDDSYWHGAISSAEIISRAIRNPHSLSSSPPTTAEPSDEVPPVTGHQFPVKP